EEAGTGLATRAARFVVDGTDEDVLLTLGGLPEAGKALCLTSAAGQGLDWGLVQRGNQERLAIFQPGKGLPADPGIGLGQVFEAAGRPSTSQGQAKDELWKAWPDWLLVLIGEMLATGHYYSGQAGATWSIPDFEAVLQAAELPADLLARTALGSHTYVVLGYY